MSRSYRSPNRSGSAGQRDWRRYEDDYKDKDKDYSRDSNYGRDDSKDYDRDEDREKREELKPYKAVGAALDSAERQRRRMTYGRVTPKP